MSIIINYTNMIKNTDEAIVIPIVKSSEKDYNWQTSFHPIERGEDIADHRAKKPLKIVVNVVIPDKDIQTIGFSKTQTDGTPTDVSQVINLSSKEDILQTLIYLGDENEVLSLYISGETMYDDMVLENIKNKEDENTGGNFNLELSFTHVKFASARKAVISDEIRAKLGSTAQNNTNAGSGTTSKGTQNSSPYDSVINETENKEYSSNYAVARKFANRTSDWVMPVNDPRVTSPFGNRKSFNSKFHKGIDLAHIKQGDPVYSVDSGIVTVSAFDDNGYGNWVQIRHPNGLLTRYGHLSKREVAVGTKVSRGQIIGDAGSTGHSTGVHVHFEVRSGNTPLPPTTVMKGFTA